MGQLSNLHRERSGYPDGFKKFHNINRNDVFYHHCHKNDLESILGNGLLGREKLEESDTILPLDITTPEKSKEKRKIKPHGTSMPESPEIQKRRDRKEEVLSNGKKVSVGDLLPMSFIPYTPTFFRKLTQYKGGILVLAINMEIINHLPYVFFDGNAASNDTVSFRSINDGYDYLDTQVDGYTEATTIEILKKSLNDFDDLQKEARREKNKSPNSFDSKYRQLIRKRNAEIDFDGTVHARYIKYILYGDSSGDVVNRFDWELEFDDKKIMLRSMFRKADVYGW